MEAEVRMRGNSHGKAIWSMLGSVMVSCKRRFGQGEQDRGQGAEGVGQGVRERNRG